METETFKFQLRNVIWTVIACALFIYSTSGKGNPQLIDLPMPPIQQFTTEWHSSFQTLTGHFVLLDN